MIANQSNIVSLRGYYRKKSLRTNPHLVCPWLVRHHMPLELGAVGERVATKRAGKVLFILLVAVLDVLLQRCQALVATVAVGAGQQLGKSIWSSRWQVCSREARGRGAGQKVSKSMAANGLAARAAMTGITTICSSRAPSLRPASSQPGPLRTQGRLVRISSHCARKLINYLSLFVWGGGDLNSW